MSALLRATSGLALLGLLGLLSGCTGLAADSPAGTAEPVGAAEPAGSETGSTHEAATAAAPTTLTVLAAASLTAAFSELAEDYESSHPDVTINLSFGSSTTLSQQIVEGVDADLYASAGRAALEQLPTGYADEGGEETIASNVLEIAVQPGNPRGVTGIDDFTRSDLDTVLCAQTVPCGRAADEAFAAAGLTPTPVSREIDVKATLAKITLGEADAAIVYRSDVLSTDQVDGVVIPAGENVSITYPLVWFNTEAHTVGFAELLAGPKGLAALEAAGFSAP